MIHHQIETHLARACQELYKQMPEKSMLQLQATRPEFTGEFTIVVFPLLRLSKKNPQQTAEEIGNYLLEQMDSLRSFEVIKGFLNLSMHDSYWVSFLSELYHDPQHGMEFHDKKLRYIIEYSSPNTNKPLHLGHIRNNLLGWSVAEILKATGHEVVKVNLVNDRGIHICKSMVAWQEFSKGETPSDAGIKGDKLVGAYYVKFEKGLKKQLQEKLDEGLPEKEAVSQTSLMQKAQQMLIKWEKDDVEVRRLWEMMNGWVYEGFNTTYKRLGIDFDQIYYESETYLLGKQMVSDGLDKGVFIKKVDGSVWCDLSDEGLDEKLLQRADGTSVYMTQDLGTAQMRYDAYHPDLMLYVVGNEQNYHFDVLKKILKKLNKTYADGIRHLSYGMVELPSGKMKSREGTTVDADDLMEEMHQTARATTEALSKNQGLDEMEASHLYEMLGMGALKYFILKVDPKKNMLFDPQESIDFNGNTGPFVQYTHARIKSLLRKAASAGLSETIVAPEKIHPKEKEIIRQLYAYPEVLQQAAETFSPALIANYVHQLARVYNQFYQEIWILSETNRSNQQFRLGLSGLVAARIRESMRLLGIEVPEQM